jgi:hypothetical protein
MSRSIAGLAAVLLLAGCALPGTVQARAFTTGFKAGETIRYRLHTTVSGFLQLGSQQIPLTSDQTLAMVLDIVSVDPAGTATVKVTTEDVIGNSGGSPGGDQAPVTVEIASDGRIKSGHATQPSGRVPSIPGSDQLTPVLSSQEVKPGDHWDLPYSRPNPFGPGTLSFTAHSRYVKDEALAGKAAAVIDTSLEGQIDFTIDTSQLPTHYVGTFSSSRRYWVDLAGHQVLKSTGTATYRVAYAITAPAGQASGPVQLEFIGQVKSELTRI